MRSVQELESWRSREYQQIPWKFLPPLALRGSSLAEWGRLGGAPGMIGGGGLGFVETAAAEEPALVQAHGDSAGD